MARRAAQPPPKPAKAPPPENEVSLPALTICALGVVFGDIGTSPLYALHQCFGDMQTSKVDSASVLGILSLVFWALVLVVCVKYLGFINRADHQGEGGTLAMLALIQSRRRPSEIAPPGVLVLLVFLGSALLFGDGIITPAISVLSAVEGLKVATPGAGSFVVPLALGILVALFLIQQRGTGQVGVFFGPVMALWFLSAAALGIGGIVQAPQVLQGLNPWAGVSFLAHHGAQGIVVLGGVVLAFSGAEALFADLSHFGRVPIELGWYALVLPSLVLNYFGQGALLLQHPEQLQTPFYTLVPHPLLIPMVILATAATVIASQALISGVFSLTQQAIHMGYFPRFEITHTSSEERGQVYVSAINYLLMVACVGVVLVFRSSDKLGNAYGLAVIGTMTITSVVYFFVARRVWHWSLLQAVPLCAFFLTIDLAFLAGNVVKILSGAWVPLLFALAIFGVFWTWSWGRARFRRALRAWSMPINDFTHEIERWNEREAGTAVFCTTHANTVPLVGRNHWLREMARHEQVLLLTILEEKIPFVAEADAAHVEEIAPGFWRITAAFGFMQHPDVTRVLEAQACHQLKIDGDRLVCYLPEPTLVPLRTNWQHKLVLRIFKFLLRNSLTLAEYFRVPPRQIIHVGVRLEI
jgi:KUP system potassium uptake protein